MRAGSKAAACPQRRQARRRGGAICEVPGAVWMVPPHCAVWVPGDLPHSNRVTPNARICLLFVEPGASALPDKPCTLAISPLVRELVQHLAGLPHDDPADGPTVRLARVLLNGIADWPPGRVATDRQGRCRRVPRQASLCLATGRHRVFNELHQRAIDEASATRPVGHC